MKTGKSHQFSNRRFEICILTSAAMDVAIIYRFAFATFLTLWFPIANADAIQWMLPDQSVTSCRAVAPGVTDVAVRTNDAGQVIYSFITIPDDPSGPATFPTETDLVNWVASGTVIPELRVGTSCLNPTTFNSLTKVFLDVVIVSVSCASHNVGKCTATFRFGRWRTGEGVEIPTTDAIFSDSFELVSVMQKYRGLA